MHDEEEIVYGARPSSRRSRWIAAVVGALVVAGAVWLAVRANHDANPRATTSGTTPSVGASTTVVPLPMASPPPCSGTAVCIASTMVPSEVRAALREYYRGARVASVRTVTTLPAAGTGTLVRRTIAATAGTRHFAITVTQFVLGPDDFDRATDGNRSIVTVKSTGSGKTVVLQLMEPRSARADDLTVLRLARDPRLAALR